MTVLLLIIITRMKISSQQRRDGILHIPVTRLGQHVIFFNVRALVTREIMRSKDAHCNTTEWP